MMHVIKQVMGVTYYYIKFLHIPVAVNSYLTHSKTLRVGRPASVQTVTCLSTHDDDVSKVILGTVGP